MPKILKSVHSRKMKEPVSENYGSTDKPSSYSLSCTSSQVCKAGLNCRTTSICMELVLPLCPNQAFLWQNAVLSALGKNYEGWRLWVLHHKHFHLHSQGERRCLLLKKCWFLLVKTCQGIQLKWVDLIRFFGQWGYGLRGICFCRDQDMKVFFTGWRIQGGSSVMLG